MITIEALREYGADVDAGLARCVNNEEFYLKMVTMGIADERFDSLKEDLIQKNFAEAFEKAHALKGVLGNLGLTPVLEPVSEMTELLRSRTDTDYLPLYERIRLQRDQLKAM